MNLRRNLQRRIRRGATPSTTGIYKGECRICRGPIFSKNTRPRVFCSDACGQVASHLSRPRVRVCLCGGNFIGKQGQKYCHKACVARPPKKKPTKNYGGSRRSYLELEDYYVATTLAKLKGENMTREDFLLYPEIIELQRKNIRLLRAIRKVDKEKKCTQQRSVEIQTTQLAA